MDHAPQSFDELPADDIRSQPRPWIPTGLPLLTVAGIVGALILVFEIRFV